MKTQCRRILVIIAAFIAVILVHTHSDAGTSKGTVTTDGLNVRTGAGTNYDILKLDGNYVKLTKGTAVTIKEELAGGWYHITCTYNSKPVEGYVASMYVTIEVDKSILASYTGISGKLITKQRVHSKGTAKSAYIKHNGKALYLKKGTKVTITGVKKVSGVFWYQISFTYKKTEYSGYISSAHIKLTGKKVVSYIYKKTSVYSKTSLSGLLKIKKQPVRLKQNKKIVVTGEKTAGKKKWFKITFSYKGKSRKGWVPASNVMFKSGKAPATPAPTITPVPTARPAVILSDAEFEASMASQGFPERYKAGLRQLHSQYPYWQFAAVKTGLDWNTSVEKESALGKSLVPNTRTAAWKSTEPGAYNWTNDSYVVFDGLQWVAASKEAVAYYMDPRNFLVDKYVFMFEALAYEPAYQNVTGVATIFNNTMLGSNPFAYTDDSGVTVTKTYNDAVMEAAAATGVSPYHLASRIRQEVVTGTSTLSNSVTGTVAGYEGIYNFYNIGASDSSSGDAVLNGLKFASSGTTYMRPWNNRYRSIVGGAQYIANNYIARGQNTLYLERFNVTDNNTYEHQYMTNVAAAYSEANKVYTAYKEWMATVPILFYIPIYDNMPEKACEAPTGNLNPNNYLNSLTVTGAVTGTQYLFTPEFAVADGGSVTYTVTVPAAEGSVVISAGTVNQNATVLGTGERKLALPTETVTLQVTAQNGTVRTYTIIINVGL